MSDDYTKAPSSLAERRALGSGNPRDWSPREMLVHLLRRLDSGEMQEPDHLMILYGTENEDGYNSTGFLQAGNFSPLTQMGVLHSTLHSLLHSN